tara:strand:- start:2160 stop:2282 length:123 start_codon:yes stop_codon:yes gene_type:complete
MHDDVFVMVVSPVVVAIYDGARVHMTDMTACGDSNALSSS